MIAGSRVNSLPGEQDHAFGASAPATVPPHECSPAHKPPIPAREQRAVGVAHADLDHHEQREPRRLEESLRESDDGCEFGGGASVTPTRYVGAAHCSA